MFPILIRIGDFSLSTYGFLVAISYLIAILWLKSQIKDMPDMDENKFWTLIYALFFGAIMGGKLLFVAVEWRTFSSGELSFFGDFRYGFVFFGGLLGSMVMGVLATRWCHLPYFGTADYFGVALPMGHWLGRLGCLAAGCCYGRPTTLPWGVTLNHPASSTPEELWSVPLHPVQVYESMAVLAIFLYLWRRVLALVKKRKLPPGTVFWGYVFLYSLARFILEYWRGDDRGFSLGSFSPSQWISLICMAAAAAMIARSGARLKLLVSR